ncbi:MAG: site-specific integrase, partial [Pseudomonadota bacterium]|nr:site-specific integrase [Pseudomonadota bacterium]
RPGPAHRRQNRKLLTNDQVRMVLDEAERDKKWGAYYAFLLLTGVRPSEMLGLLWESVDLENGTVLICRTQNMDGTLKETPKTEAGIRQIPLNNRLREMLYEWQERCPRVDGKLFRAFPAQPNEYGRGGGGRIHNDGRLLLSNFRIRVWYPMLDRLGLPRISIYAARHMVISYLQAQGVEVGLVAKIAGHSSPQITLQYYTHAVREYDDMMDKLDAAFALEDRSSIKSTQVQE